MRPFLPEYLKIMMLYSRYASLIQGILLLVLEHQDFGGGVVFGVPHHHVHKGFLSLCAHDPAFETL